MPHDTADARIEGVAIEWVIRQGAGPLDESDQAALDRWLASDVRHAQAFTKAHETWASLDVLAENPGSLREDLPASRPYRRYFAFRGGFAGITAMAACVAIMVGMGGLWYGNPLTAIRADYRTGYAQTQQVALADGSQVRLGPASAIAIYFDGRERRIDLLSGVADFTAVPMAQAGNRPFVVASGQGEARALGTRFIVERLPENVGVTVLEHKVQVTAQGQSAVVLPGQQVHYDDMGVGPPAGMNADLATGWQRGRLIVDAAPLGDAVAQFNRYQPGRILLARPGLAHRKVSGVFDARDIDGAVATIVAELHVHAVRIGPLVTVLY